MNVVAKTSGTEAAQPFFFEKSRLMVVAINRADNLLVYRAQTKPNGPWEALWTAINQSNSYDIMAAGMARDGRVIVLAQTHSNPTLHFYIETANDMNQNWEAPVNLGLPAGIAGFSQVITQRDSDGWINLFGIAAGTGAVWWMNQNRPVLVTKKVTVTPPGTKDPITIDVQEEEPPPTPWSNWQQLGTQTLALLTGANLGDGRIALAGSVFQNARYGVFFSQSTIGEPSAPSDWTPWTQIDAQIYETLTPALRLDALSVLNVFGISRNSVVQTRQSPPGVPTFSTWARPGMPGDAVINEIAAGVDGDGHIVVVAEDENRSVYANAMYDVSTQQWWGWEQIGIAPVLGPLTLEYNADGRLTLFVRNGTGIGELYCISQIAFNSSSWEAEWTRLSPADGLMHYGVVRDLTPPASAFS